MALVRFLIYSFAILITGYILPGISVDSFLTAMITALVLGIVSFLLKPVLLILTLPINVLTLGLFTFIVNAALVLLVDYLIAGFEVSGILWAIIFGLVVSIVNSILNLFVKD